MQLRLPFINPLTALNVQLAGAPLSLAVGAAGL